MASVHDRRRAATIATINDAFGTQHGAEIFDAAYGHLKGRKGIRHPVALLTAVAELESNGRNIYGHDPVANPAPKGGAVTKENYLGTYLPARKAGLGMQGVGPFQLTWYGLQNEADRRGGCWEVEHNASVAADELARLISVYGLRSGLAHYNGTGWAAQQYAVKALASYAKWWLRFWRITRRIK